jgi:serine/threonine-protein kinase
MISSPASANVQPGDVLVGKYRVERVIGTGGMGVVVAAQHIALDERVALKFLLPNALFDPTSIGRFVREAQTAVRIKSEHVARISDVGTFDDGAPYIVMEYLEGTDLKAVVASKGPLPVAEAVDYLLQASEALAEAHSLGIVHRDIKPANLFVTHRRDGSALVKVLDFGISKLIESKDANQGLTTTATMLGSPLYMSPEQARSAKSVDTRTDIWSLGTVLFELLSGKSPFDGDTLAALVAKIVADPPASLRALRPDVPPGLEAVVLKCLEKDASKRPQTIADLAALLAPFAPPKSQVSVQRIAGIERAPDSSLALAQTMVNADGLGITADAAMVSTTDGRSSSRGRRWTVVALFAALTLGLVGVVATRARSMHATKSAAATTAPKEATSELTLPPPPAVVAVPVPPLPVTGATTNSVPIPTRSPAQPTKPNGPRAATVAAPAASTTPTASPPPPAKPPAPVINAELETTR